MSKRMTELKGQIEADKLYTLDEAIELVKKTSTVKFDATVELHAKLGIDPKKGDQQVRATVSLPHGTGKTKKIAAFVDANDKKAAEDAGADLVLDEQDIEEIKKTGKTDFDVAVATPQMMQKLAAAAKVLGPKGLMPNPKSGTVDADVTKMITELKGGKAPFKNDGTGIVHMPIGKVSYEENKIKENVIALIEALKKNKPQGAKGAYLKSVFITSSMGPSVKLDPANLE